MKKLILLFTLFGYLLSTNAQEKYSKVKIYATNQQIQQLADLGIPVDHGSRKFDTWLVTDISASDIQKLEANGFAYSIEIDDVSKYYAKRAYQNFENTKGGDDRENCGNGSGSSGFTPTVPANFNLGSMGGYLTYAEFIAELDSMSTAYPNLITVKDSISNFLTWENRPIYWLKISDNPNTDEAENEVLYTSIHHAREPNSLMSTLFYMWYLLENYGTDPEVTYLVDHTEMYFVPMINPDGYVENVVSNPNGGGMHRKNKRNVGTYNPGVDLNRNYDYQWNVAGTSPDVNNDTYAGTGPFSEPETQAIKWFCEQHDFEFALNAHSYSNLLLYPFGWSSGATAADANYFSAYSGHQVLFNGYVSQKSSALYAAAGDSDDWMYDGDLMTKPSIYAQTPEIGSDDDGFWPAASRIIPLAQENVWMNLIQGHLPHIYGYAQDTDPSSVANTSGYFHYDFQRLGLENGTITVTMEAVSGIQSLGTGNDYNLNLAEMVSDSISYTLDPDIVFGDEIKYVLKTNVGLWTRTDTITKSFGQGTAVFQDDFTDASNWSGNWSLTTEYFVSPSNSMTDSPNSNYSNNTLRQTQLNDIFSFENATYANATFYAKWDIEAGWDYVEFMISIDNGSNWIPLCGKYTTIGNGNQDNGQPLYDGTQDTWVFEEVDLSDYLGESNVQFKFRLVSDQAVTADGFAFDDFNILTDHVSDLGLDNQQTDIFKLYPNPTNDQITIYTTPNNNINHVEVYNNLGQLVTTIKGNSNKCKVNVSDFENGVYFVKIYNANNQIVTKKFTVAK
ncbi:MAG: M14 family zinc carboxypeptidase [Putridiphycobacter sp.]